MNPKITVVTVCYNAEKEIESTILSVINQTYTNIEYIIVDGASKDSTMDIVNRYRDKISIVVSEPDQGIFDAMNKGIKLASGEWINFMNAGDYFASNKVLENIFTSNFDTNNSVIYGSWYLKYKQNKRLIKPFPFFENNHKFRGMGFSHQTVFVPTMVVKQVGFDLNYKLAADYNMIWHLYYDAKLNFCDCGIPVSVMNEEEGATERCYKRHIEEVCDVCGIPNGGYRILIVSQFFISHMIKRFFKSNF